MLEAKLEGQESCSVAQALEIIGERWTGQRTWHHQPRPLRG
jgi:DNA-binding HxlR family transcriptional regulator